MYETIKPFCHSKILEIGSGVGNISGNFLEDKFDIVLSDIRENYLRILKNKFKNPSHLLDFILMDIIGKDFNTKFSPYFHHFDTVFGINVVEHIHDDVLAFYNCKKLLKKGGKLIILVPSYQFLFNETDRAVGHYRRYTKSSLTDVFLQTGYKVIHKQYFNFMGIFGWYLNGKILKKKTISKRKMLMYENLMPLIKILDKIIFNSIGLSTIVVGEKIED